MQSLGDERLNERAKKILSAFSENLGINGSFGIWQEIKAAYRFFDQEFHV